MSTFPERIRIVIDNRFDGKQRNLAAALGTSETAVFKWLNGTVPRDPTMQAIASAAHVSYAWLTTGEGEMEEPPVSGVSDAIATLGAWSLSDPDHIGRLLELIAAQDPQKFRVVADMILDMCKSYSDQQKKDGE